MTGARHAARGLDSVGPDPATRQRLRDSISGAGAERGGHLTIVSGQPGTGRTTVLEALRRELIRSDRAAELVSCTDSGVEIPFAPFTRFIDEPRATVAEGLHALRSTLAELVPTGAAAGRHPPLTLLVDDAHHLDGPSAVLLHQLVRFDRFDAILATCSTRPLPPDLASLTSTAGATWIDLVPLDRSDTDRLAEELHGRPLDSHQLERVWQLTRGLPAYVSELVAGPLGDVAAPAPSVQLKAQIERRLDELGVRQDILTALTLHDRLPEDVCVDVFGADAMRAAYRSALVRRVDQPNQPVAALGFGLVSVVAAERVTRRERVAVADALLDAFGQADGPDHSGWALARAELLMVVGRTDAAVFESAADTALRRHDPLRALDLAQRAVASGAGPGAALTLASALSLLGRQPEAEAIFAQASRDADPEIATRAYRRWALALLFDTADADGAHRVLSAATEQLPAAGARLMSSQLPNVRFYSGDCTGALQAIDEWEAVGGQLSFDALPGALSACVAAGQPTRAMEVMERHERWQWGHTMTATSLVWVRMLALLQLGRLGEIDGPTDGLADIDCSTLMDSMLLRRVMPASLSLLRGSLGDPRPTAADLAALQREAPPQVAAFAFALSALHDASSGRVEDARSSVDRLGQLPESSSAGFSWWTERVEVICLAAEGRRSEAATAALELAAGYDAERFYFVTSLHDAARFGAATAVRHDLAAAARLADATWWDRVCADHAAALHALDPELLTEVSERFERGGLLLCALEAITDAIRLGDTTSAAGRLAIERARIEQRRLERRCGDVATLARTEPGAGLTEREFTVAMLAARGMTSPDIAQHLGTSARTVSNQLQSAYQKLGVHSREELSSLVSKARRPRSDSDRGRVGEI